MLPEAFKVDKDDIFNQSEDSEIWQNIKKHMERQVLLYYLDSLF
jgi:hypothetical protein